jgi:hypothetical protein
MHLLCASATCPTTAAASVAEPPEDAATQPALPSSALSSAVLATFATAERDGRCARRSMVQQQRAHLVA